MHVAATEWGPRWTTAAPRSGFTYMHYDTYDDMMDVHRVHHIRHINVTGHETFVWFPHVCDWALSVANHVALMAARRHS